MKAPVTFSIFFVLGVSLSQMALAFDQLAQSRPLRSHQLEQGISIDRVTKDIPSQRRTKSSRTRKLSAGEKKSSLGSPLARPWRLHLLGGLPELYGIQADYQVLPWAYLYGFYMGTTLLKVETTIKKKTLVRRDDFSIKSPEIPLNLAVDFGPHMGAGFNFYPFSESFFLGFGLERRLITISSNAEAQFIFSDNAGQSLSNTLVEASIRSRTEQQMLRLTFGYDWTIGDQIYFVSLFGGMTKPLKVRTKVKSDINVINSQASDAQAGPVDGLEEAEVKQEEALNQSARDTIGPYEHRNLPLIGLSLGFSF